MNSLLLRAIIAVVLMFGFYAFALGIAGVLFALPLLEMAYAHTLHIKLALICGLGGLAILWAIRRVSISSSRPGHCSPRRLSRA